MSSHCTVRLVILAIAACLLASCAAPPDAKREAQKVQTLWPAPPEQPRFAYEIALRSAADIFVDSEDAKLRRMLTGERVSDDRVLEKPSAVAARNGRIYVTDTVNRFVLVFDVPRRRIFRFGLRDPGTLAKPIALAIDENQFVYIADATLRQVMVYDNLGLFQRAIGDRKELERPTGVAVSASGERIYVIDRANNESERHRVVIFDREGNKVGEIGARGSEPGQFNVPVQGAVAADGTLYVLDAGNFRVQAFDADGKFLRSFGKVGNTLGDLARPRGLALDRDGNVYVSDGAFGNVQIFNTEGALLLTIGALGKTDQPGRYGLPSGLAVDETGRLYVVDQYFNKIEVFRRLSDEEGQRLAR